MKIRRFVFSHSYHTAAKNAILDGHGDTIDHPRAIEVTRRVR